MARIRTIKPEFWMDYSLAKGLTRDQRLFYIGLWNEADDEGRISAHPRRLLGVIFPYEMDLDERWVKATLETLHEAGKLVLFSVSGEPYAELAKFSTHQYIQRPSRSLIPPPSSDLAQIHGGVSESLREPSCQERKGKERILPELETDPIPDLWGVFVEELGGQLPHPRLTKKRRQKLLDLWREQLQRHDSPLELFRRVLLAVKKSDHHMSNRDYQMPESLFLNPERRDKWVQKAVKPETRKPKTTGQKFERLRI